MVECCKAVFLLNGEEKKTDSFKEEWLESKGAVYEVFRLLDGTPFMPHDNIVRLEESLELMEYDYSVEEERLVEDIEKLASLNSVSQGNVKYVLLKQDNKYVELMFFIPHHYPSKEEQEQGVETLLLHAKRLNPTIKMINKDLRGLANSIIAEENVFEVLLVDDTGFITEGSRSNFFTVKNNVVYTPPVDTVLPGTVRKRAIEICQNYGVDIIERSIHYSSIDEYDAAFLTATSLGVQPIKSINSTNFDVDNEVVRLLQKEYINMLKNR